MLENVKSKYIIKEIFEMIKNKRKLNIIKYNKTIQSKLNINKEDFEMCTYLKEFNQKYKTSIGDIDIRELYLSEKNINNEGLKDLIKIKFKDLKKLYLIKNKISNINTLNEVNFEELKILDLNGNYISDINALEKVKFNKLKYRKLVLISHLNILNKKFI